MLRAVQDSFYTHVIPYLLWDDFFHFSNNRAVLRLVDKRAYTAVSRWVFPNDILIARVSRYFPLHDKPVFNWQHTTALHIVTKMILYSPKIRIICVPRQQGKTHFLIQFALMAQCPVELLVFHSRFKERIGQVSSNCVVRAWYDATIRFDGIVLDDGCPEFNVSQKFTVVTRIRLTSDPVGTHLTQLPHIKILNINVH